MNNLPKREWGVYRRPGGVGCLQPGEKVPAGRGGFQASNGKKGFPTPASNATMGNWED